MTYIIYSTIGDACRVGLADTNCFEQMTRGGMTLGISRDYGIASDGGQGSEISSHSYIWVGDVKVLDKGVRIEGP